MPTITDWIMVCITAVYVIATILICLANMRSAKATRDQLAESKRQFEETKRLHAMPYLQVNVNPGKLTNNGNPQVPYTIFVITDHTLTNCVSGVYRITLKNVGLGMLHHTQISWDSESRNNDKYPERDIVIPPQVEWKVTGLFTGKKAEYDDSMTRAVSAAQLIVKYDDLLGNSYYQIVKFTFIISNVDVRIVDCYITSPSIYENKEAPHA